MRIGIDARTLSGRFTGDRTYWRGLIQGLAEVDTENEYVLYTRLPVDGEPPVVNSRFTWRMLPKPGHDALWMSTAFPQALRQDKIDVAHTQYNTPLFGAPCPIVTTVHDITFAIFPEHFLRKDRWILNKFVPGSMRRACKVIAVSECTRRDILRRYKLHIGPEKVVATPLAADKKFQPPAGGQESARAALNEKYGLRDLPYILALGVLQPRKNIAMLLDAFALAKLGPHAIPHTLVIVGKRGWKNEELDAHLAKLPESISSQIIFTGYAPDEELPLFYGGADAFCYPSLYEGFGLPPLEAMACGCPALCSQISSLPEVVGDAGILLPTGDSDAWATALEKVVTDPKVRARWSDRGLERAKEFSWERTARKTLEIYKTCAGL